MTISTDTGLSDPKSWSQSPEFLFQATLDVDGKYPYSEKRPSEQVAELIVNNGVLEVKDRNKPFNFYFPI